nr:putative sulfotransferase [Oceanusvirus sp.]
MYTFVHPTKTGGTAVEEYFKKYHAKHIRGVGHMHTCTNSPKPLIVIRDPMERFVSMFNYWRNGAVSGKYVRKKDWLPPCDTISEFVKRLQENDPKFVRKHLHKDFTTHLHFSEQSHWIKPGDYAKTVVVVYDRQRMDEKIRDLLRYLHLPEKGLPLPRVNVTKTSPLEASEIGPKEEEWIRRRFKKDFELWHMVNKHQSRFKKVF